MRTGTLLFLFCFCKLCFAQSTYTTPFTQHFPTGEIETINRTIKISDKEIIVLSETPVNSLHKQTFVINEISEKEFPNHGLSKFFVTSSKDNIYTTYFLIPIKEKIEIIEVIQPQQLDKLARHYRFLID